MFVSGFQEIDEKVESRLGKRRTKRYSSRNWLHLRLWDCHPAFRSFMTGAHNGLGTHFHCRVCDRDVAMKSHGSGEFSRHFESNVHWFKDVAYRVHSGLPALNRLMEPMELSPEQYDDYKSHLLC